MESGARIKSVDGLRGLAILLVLLYHSVFHVRVANHQVNWLLSLGSMAWSGVDLFFVLSGFLIGGILIDARESPSYYKTFYARRAYRILPLYFAVLLTCLVLGVITGPVPNWTFFVFAQNIGMALCGAFGGGGLALTWSLAVEEQFYMTVPVIVRAIRRSSLIWLTGAVILMAPLLRACLLEYAHNGGFASYVLMPCRADALAMGILCAILVRDSRALLYIRQYRRGLYAVAGLLVLVVLKISPHYELFSKDFHGLEYSLLGLLYASALLIAVSEEDAIVRIALCNKPLMQLGNIAYGTYLFHFLFLLWFQELGRAHLANRPQILRGGIALSAMMAAIAVATVSWRYFEKPLVKRGHRYQY
jgi:peptidoglycan/LPS O-acetylase OafA/YrhL